jgi:CheY-like chemotaxis protein/DNA-binding XRE family transcriptional regulator
MGCYYSGRNTLVQSFDVTKPFGAAVKIWRNRLCISQEELAGRAGLHRTYISDIERGARNVSLISIEKLARALEISTATLFSYEAASDQSGASRLAEEGLVDILFAEDDPRDAELAIEALKGITNWVQVVHDGQAALDFLFCQGQFAHRQMNQRPQLVLLDLRLPKIDGLEVLRRVKSDPRTAAIPVVVLTGSERDRDIRTSKRLGAAAYIVKPVEMVNLTHVAPIVRFQWALVKPLPALAASGAVRANSFG